MKLIAVLVALAACGSAQHPVQPKGGTIAGVARDHDSGDPVSKATIVIRPEGALAAARTVKTDAKGNYSVPALPGGAYSLSASFAGQPISVEHITVTGGHTAIVDLTFTLGKPDPITVDFGNPKEGAIDRYRPAHHSPATGVIEGVVTDSGSRERVPGAVVTAARGEDALQAVTDDEGRYKFDDVEPGTYVVSAYYSIGGRAQIEIRRSDIAVAGGEGVIVPLWIEVAKQ
ncbi:MAG TPA: carboxypeptidase-like regulatory domain-containing protein [Kofleriaceae bacterium]|nr:carboxypeptidase-like regulatory domain-containing protein [Kofleriaceae bacterium]